MKKMIPVLLAALLMAMILSGCEAKPQPFVSGNVSGRTYENAQLGLQCIAPADWVYLTEAELLQLSEVELTEEGGEKDAQLTAHLVAGGNVQDMYVMTEDGLQTINVMLTRIDPTAQELTLAEFADLGRAESEEVYSAMGITEVETQREQVLFLNESCEAIRLSGAYADVPLYSLQLCMERGEYICVVTFNSFVEDTTGMMIKFFHPLTVGEE